MLRYCFFLQSSRCVFNEQSCLKTTGPYDDLLLLSSLFHFFYFIFSAPISFSLCSPISPSLFLCSFSSLYQVFSSVQFSSVAQSCLTLCDPMNCSTPGLPVHHQLPEFTQTPVHRVGDAVQPFHALSSPSPALNLSQHQDLFR